MVRLGIFGSGIITDCHFLGLDKTDAQIVAIASVDEASGRKACTKYGAEFYADYNNLLHKEKLDAVIVALPNHMHYESCVASINAGVKNILCEKPMCTRLEDSKKLMDLVSESGVLFQVAYMKRFNPGFELIKQTIPKIGQIEFVNTHIYMSGAEPISEAQASVKSWHSDAKKSGGGIITHSTSHHIDLLRYYFGDVKTIRAKARYEFEGTRDYYMNGWFEMEDGTDIQLQLGKIDVPNLGPSLSVVRGAWDECVEVIGTRGFIKVENPTWQGFGAMKVTRWMQGESGPETFYIECNLQWVYEMQSFVESVKKGQLEAKSSSVVDGYKVDLIIEKIHESSKAGGRIIEIDCGGI